ncbi:MAG: NAD-dependent epimerase/dehydratase family protein [Myxococcales bacterium]|nr:MAG: NAD-dependent epimerase/dehydratase family protein [Myxococcales bacterium]
MEPPVKPEHVLITGGAGFIGSHVADACLRRGYRVTAYDSLDAQVHPSGRWPGYLDRRVRRIRGDICDAELLRKALRGCDLVFHLAAAVGVEQSQSEAVKYARVNSLGTATLLEVLIRMPRRPKKLVVASSMSVYGEGAYFCPGCGVPREPAGVEARDGRRGFEPRCAACRTALVSKPVAERHPLRPLSFYAVTKRGQEETALALGRAHGIPVVALRLFNTYGPRQALSNPYNGVLAIFANALLRGEAPIVHEDGAQRRDFTSVRDAARAFLLAADTDRADGRAVNVGTGRPRSVLDVAELLAGLCGARVRPTVSGAVRSGDIRHCHADISLARRRLGYRPAVKLEDGLVELVRWARRELRAG